MEAVIREIIEKIDSVEAYNDAISCLLLENLSSEKMFSTTFILISTQQQKIDSLTLSWDALKKVSQVEGELLKISCINQTMICLISLFSEDKKEQHINSLSSISKDQLQLIHVLREFISTL